MAHYITDALPLALHERRVRRRSSMMSPAAPCARPCATSGDWSTLLLADVMSGAMLKNIVDRAKTKAVMESVRQGTMPVDRPRKRSTRNAIGRATLAEVNLEQGAHQRLRRAAHHRPALPAQADEAEGTYGMEQV